MINYEELSKDDALLNLAAEIVKLAAYDVVKRPCNGESTQTRLTRERNRNSAECFFKSQWYGVLTLGRDGKEDLIKIKKNAGLLPAEKEG